MIAADKGHTDMLNILIQLGADINIKDNVSYIISTICYYNYNYVMIEWIHSFDVCCCEWLYRYGNYPTKTRS